VTLRFKRGPAYLPGVSEIKMHPDRLDQPLRWRRPRRIFVCSMSDLFHEDVPDTFIGRVFETMCMAEQHTFQILTKRPERMKQFMAKYTADGGPLPPMSRMGHLWLGVSVENQYWADRRIPLLLQTPAAVRFLSLEPLLKDVDLWDWLPDRESGRETPNIHWVIVGGESGPKHRPMELDWIRAIQSQCVAAGVPVFVKQDSGPKPGQQGRLSDDLWALKEFPEGSLR
jgi:protein gp37